MDEHPKHDCEYCGIYHTSWTLQTKGKLEHNHNKRVFLELTKRDLTDLKKSIEGLKENDEL